MLLARPGSLTPARGARTIRLVKPILRVWFLAFLGWCLAAGLVRAAAPALVIDDEDYVEQVAKASGVFMAAGRLVPAATLRAQVGNKAIALTPLPLLKHKLDGPDLCDFLRGSVLALGSYYHCPDCGDWHFSGSAGFMVADGIACTCCHVVLGEDEGIKESFLVAADAAGHVYPVRSVAAADTASDTCFLRLEGCPLKPLPLRAEVRPGERVYCLSHPGGYYFMFTQGMIARLNRRPNEVYDDKGRTNGTFTRPILFLNVTAEFAPGSSGAPVVDDAGNVVGQVASIADAGEPSAGDTNAPASPSVPVRFCTASREIMSLFDGAASHRVGSGAGESPARRPPHRPKADSSRRPACPRSAVVQPR